MAARIQEVKDHLEKALHDKTKPWATALDMAESKTGVDRLYIFVGECCAIYKKCKEGC